MTKAEMEAHHAAYRAGLAAAKAAEREGLCQRAVELALSSWEHIDGMMQYERKYLQRDFESIESIDLVLRYAPMLLNSKSLDTLESLLKARRRIEKDTSEDMGANLAAARQILRHAHRLWDYIEHHDVTRQDELRQVLGGEQNMWRQIAESWERMGLLDRVPDGRSYRLQLATRLGQVIRAKCPSCGLIAEAPKSIFLEESNCPQCNKNVLFVILSSAINSNQESA